MQKYTFFTGKWPLLVRMIQRRCGADFITFVGRVIKTLWEMLNSGYLHVLVLTLFLHISCQQHYTEINVYFFAGPFLF